jgi:hypothetical protein
MTRGVQDTRPWDVRLWEQVDKQEGADACWLWTGHTSHGYGDIWLGKGVTRRAHIIAFFLREGRWPAEKLDVCHSCNNPLCVRHIYEGRRHHLHNVPNFDCGHPKSEENSQWRKVKGAPPRRRCAMCHARKNRAYMQQKRAKARSHEH